MKKTVEAYRALVEGSRTRPFEEQWVETHAGRTYAVERRSDLLEGPVVARCTVKDGVTSVSWELHYGFSSDIWSLYRDRTWCADVSPAFDEGSPLERVVALIQEKECEGGL